MSDNRFSDVMQQERERLNREREEIFNEQQELRNKLDGINREMQAIDAYEAAKAGKAHARQRSPGTGNGQHRVRRGSRREALLQIINEGGGLSRREILERMGLKGDKSGEMSVSNALTALTKSNQLARREGKYHTA
jgi:hypothetical protein